MAKRIKADLHIHTCLSPCADLTMTSTGIVQMAISKGMDAIAICDHNSAGNAEAVMEAAVGHGLCVIPGLEVASAEEVHILGLFGNVEDALSMQDIVYDHLEGTNDEEAFGPQALVDGSGEYIATTDKLLIGATSLSLMEVVDQIKSLNGLAIASHIDREGFSIVGQLGFIPDDLALDGLEVSPRADLDTFMSQYPGYTVVCSSDAHHLDDIANGFTRFEIEDMTFEEIRMAFCEDKGRKVIC